MFANLLLSNPVLLFGLPIVLAALVWLFRRSIERTMP